MYTIYRVEDKYGIGPFNTEYKISLLNNSWNYNHYRASRFPTQDSDFPFYISKEIYYENRNSAVLYPCQLFLWFGQDWDFISKHFKIMRIKVPKYYLGESGNQVIYDASQVISKKQLFTQKKLKFYAINTKSNFNSITVKDDANSSDRQKGISRNEYSSLLSTISPDIQF